MGVGPHDGYLLRLFGAHVKQGFGHAPYQVGSSLTQKSGWRDVDVRLMLPDDEYVAYFGPYRLARADAGKRSAWELAWTMLGRQMTGLPIDFQIQDTTVANGEHPGPRSCLQIRTSDLAVVQLSPAGESAEPGEARSEAHERDLAWAEEEETYRQASEGTER